MRKLNLYWNVAIYSMLLLIGFALGQLNINESIISPTMTENQVTLTQPTVKKPYWSDWSDRTVGQSPQIVAAESLDVTRSIADIIGQPSQFKQFAAAYPVALRADELQLQQLIEALFALESREPASIGIARIFYVRYINLNPQQAVAHFWHTVPPTSVQFRRVLYNIFHEWAWLDMDRTLQDISVNVAEIYREELIIYLLRDDHFINNPGLLALANGYSERTRAEAMLAGVDRGSNEQIFERLVALPLHSEIRQQGLFRLIRNWSQQDPQAALLRVKQMEVSTFRQNLLSTVISMWAQNEPEQALQAALAIGDGNNYAYAALSVLAKTDGIRALELTEQYQSKLDNSVKSQVMQTWASEDPKGAANYIEQFGGSQLATFARQIAWHYTLQYPEEAYRWAERMGLYNDTNLATNMGNALVQTDLDKAEQLFTQLPPSAAREGLFANIVRQKSKIDIVQSYKWLTQHSDESKFLEAQNNLLYDWTRRDPQTAAEVIVSLENNPNRSGHLTSLANSWYDRSATAALRWVYGLPTGSERDRVLASLAQKVGRSNIEQAVEIAQEVSNDQFRLNLLEQFKR